MRLFADGARRIRLLRGACGGCPRENCFASVRLVRDTVGSLLETWGLSCEYDVQQVVPETRAVARDAGVSGSSLADLGSPADSDQILRKMTPQIHSRDLQHGYLRSAAGCISEAKECGATTKQRRANGE